MAKFCQFKGTLLMPSHAKEVRLDCSRIDLKLKNVMNNKIYVLIVAVSWTCVTFIVSETSQQMFTLFLTVSTSTIILWICEPHLADVIWA